MNLPGPIHEPHGYTPAPGSTPEDARWEKLRGEAEDYITSDAGKDFRRDHLDGLLTSATGPDQIVLYEKILAALSAADGWAVRDYLDHAAACIAAVEKLGAAPKPWEHGGSLSQARGKMALSRLAQALDAITEAMILDRMRELGWEE